MIVSTASGILWLALDAFVVGLAATAGSWVWKRIFK